MNKHARFPKSVLAAALTTLLSHSSLIQAANPAMADPAYFDADAYAKRNQPTHPISEYRFALNLTSLSRGIPAGSVALLDVAQGPGRTEVMERLLFSLGQLDLGVGPETVRSTDENVKRLAVYGDGWKLKVYGDGSRAEFRHYGYLDKMEPQMAKYPPLEPEQLVELGRRFVAGVLTQQIPLDQGEELVPFGVQYQVNAQQTADAKDEPEQTTVAAAVIFSRKIDGVDVLGKGSKVAVLYTNDGTPFGFDFDWPALRPLGFDQKVAPVDELKERAADVARLGETAFDVTLERFECGYYDAGQSKRSLGVPMQPACFHFYSAKSKAEAEDGASGLLTMAYVDPVPAGTEVIPDENWDTALELLYGPEAVPARAKPGDDSTLREKLQFTAADPRAARM